MNRPETIEETEDLIRSVGGQGLVIRTDRLDILVNDIFGGDRYAQWEKRLWEHDLNGGFIIP